MGSPVLTPIREAKAGGHNGFDGIGHGDGGFGGGGGGRNPGGGRAPADIPVTGMWVAIGAIIMLFAALTGAWVILKSTAREWVPTALPWIVYVNSAILLASSLTLEFSRGCLAAGLARRFLAWLYVTLGLGIAFLAGQLAAWRDLEHRGVYLATNPSSSFFYLLTAVHGLHVLGGVIALAVAALRGPQIARGLRSQEILNVTAVYWHFMYALWIYILLLLVLRV